MRSLVLGAGSIGGYFGGRLLEARRDVTFLVRERRALELATEGLVIRSRLGNATIPRPPAVTADRLREHFDVVLLTCKAYDLPDAMASFGPAVGPQTMIVPLLNGMRHLEMLDDRFGRARVLGGKCVIAATLNERHEIVHLNDTHELSFGERDGGASDRVKELAGAFAGANLKARLSEAIVQEMWEKWVFIATCAGINCLMRADIGDIMRAAPELPTRLLDECAEVAAAQGFRPSPRSLEQCRAILTKPDSRLTASMLRDIERGSRTEGDHIVGDLLCRADGRAGLILEIVYSHLKAYEARRSREQGVAAGTHVIGEAAGSGEQLMRG
jgi:2-dehydropantoate 2-reductase